MTVSVRPAVRGDARAIATIRVETWRAAYDGLIAAEVLERLDIDREADRRETRWAENHVDSRAAEFIAEVDGEVAGWAAIGPSRDDDARGDGEVYAMYALPAFWSRGVGHALMVDSERFLRDAGYESAVLWYLEGNDRAATFYERHGWVEDGAWKDDDRLVGGIEAHALRERRRRKSLSPG